MAQEVQIARPVIKTKDIGELERYLFIHPTSADEALRNVSEKKGYFERDIFKNLQVLASPEIGEGFELVCVYGDGEILKWKSSAHSTIQVDFGYAIHSEKRPGYYKFFLVEDLAK